MAEIDWGWAARHPVDIGGFSPELFQSLPSRDQGGAFVYHVYGEAHTLLYVGITSDLLNRFAAHRRNLSLWWDEATAVEWEYYDTRETAAKVEAQDIAELCPRDNVHGQINEATLEGEALAKLRMFRRRRGIQ